MLKKIKSKLENNNFKFKNYLFPREMSNNNLFPSVWK